MERDKARFPVVTTLAHEPDHYTFARWGDVAIVHWMARADVDTVRLMHSLFKAVVKEHPQGVSFVHVIRDGAGLPDSSAREALTEMMRAFAEVTICVCVVLLGNGFWASALQSALSGMRMLAPRRRWELHFERSCAALAAWLPDAHATRTERRLNPSELAAVIDDILRTDASTSDAS